MSNTYYTIKPKLKSPWFGKPFIEYHLVKHWSQFVMGWPDNYGDDRDYQKVIFKSHNKDLVDEFLTKLSN